MLQKVYALVGEQSETDIQSKKLLNVGFNNKQIHHIDHNIETDQLLKEVLSYGISKVVFIKTRNGQACYWAKEIANLKAPNKKSLDIDIYGLDIPPHPQIPNPKNLNLIKKISCVLDTVKIN